MSESTNIIFVIFISLFIFASGIYPDAMSNSEDVYNAPSLFLNHGGGPLPVLGEENNLKIGESLKNVSQIVDLKRSKAIILVTAHREEDIVTISSNNHHDLIYDYNNFPPESYEFQYNAPGDPILAGKIQDAFEKHGVASRLDEKRGWDHGVFIPMMLINPKADIPIIQVSILKNHDAKQHYEIGKVLHQFRKDGIAIFGSGLSYHNMAELRKAIKQNDGVIVNNDFDEFLTKVCTGGLSYDDILNWEMMPGGLESHPKSQADHLMPLIVNIGAAGSKPGRKVFESVFIKKFRISGFMWD